jgi:hypothetical protein
MNDSRVELTLADGATINALNGMTTWVENGVTIELTDDFLVVRNRRAPDRFRVTDAQPVPFYFRSVVFYPDPRDLRIPQLTPFDGSTRVDPEGEKTRFVLVAETAFKHAHHEADDPAQPWYEPSKRFHMLDGGDSLVFRLAPESDQYDLTSGVVTFESPVLQQTLAYDAALRSIYPLAAANLDLYRFTAASITGSGPDDFGRYLFPNHFCAKFTSWSPDLLSGWYGFSDHQLPGDGQCNVHYGHAGHWLASYLYTGDPMRRSIGLWLVRAKCALGLIDSDPSVKNWTIGAWRGEKAGRGRRGSAIGPDSAKEWDFDLLAACALEPRDPVFLSALETRRRRLLSVPFATVWANSGGARRAGNYLRNLLDHARYARTSGDHATADAFLRRASSFAAYVFTMQRSAAQTWAATVGGPPMRWFHNIYIPHRVKAWEESVLYVALADLDEEATRRPLAGVGLSRDDRALLDEMIVWLASYGSRRGVVYGEQGNVVAVGDYVQVAYEVGVHPNYPYFYSSTPANGLWHVPLARVIERRGLGDRVPTYYSDAAGGWRRSRLVAEAFGYVGRTWQTVKNGPLTADKLRVDNAGEGPASFKMRAYAALALRVGGV